MPRKVESKRWRRDITEHLEQFPRQYAALESAMAAFGEDFDLKEFKAAFDTTEDMEAYNHVQALERALGRVQNFVAELVHDAARDFIGRYRVWIEPHLADSSPERR